MELFSNHIRPSYTSRSWSGTTAYEDALASTECCQIIVLLRREVMSTYLPVGQICWPQSLLGGAEQDGEPSSEGISGI